MGGDLHIHIAKLAFHAKESPIRTRDEVFNLVYSQSWSPVDDDSPADDSSADDGSLAIRTPPNPGLPHPRTYTNKLRTRNQRNKGIANPFMAPCESEI